MRCRLENGIDMHKLVQGEPVKFNIDPESVDLERETDSYCGKEEMFEQLNYKCLDPVWILRIRLPKRPKRAIFCSSFFHKNVLFP